MQNYFHNQRVEKQKRRSHNKSRLINGRINWNWNCNFYADRCFRSHCNCSIPFCNIYYSKCQFMRTTMCSINLHCILRVSISLYVLYLSHSHLIFMCWLRCEFCYKLISVTHGILLKIILNKIHSFASVHFLLRKRIK
jgi:hypothetical protein